MDNATMLEAFSKLGPSFGPVYVRVKEFLRQAIADGTWSEGDRLPSENELIRALGLSRMTVGRAVRELADEGVVERIIGLGTFVAARKGTPLRHELRLAAREVGPDVEGNRLEVVSLDEVDARQMGAGVAALLGERVFRSLVVHFEEDLPVQLEERIVRIGVAPEYLDQDFTRTTPSAYLNKVSRFTHGDYTVKAVLPTAEQAKLLQVGGAEPCLLIERNTWSADGAVSVARLLQPGSRSWLDGHFHA